MKPSFWSRLLGFRIIQKRGNTKYQTDLSKSFEQLEARRLMALRIWDGGAITNDRWMDRQNWVSNVAPVAGDNLLFPDSIGFFDRSLNNNFPEGTAFGNVTFEGEGYLINGNRMTLNGNLTYAPESDIALPDSKLKLDMTFGSGNHEIKLVAGAVVNPDLKFINRLDDTATGKITLSGNDVVITRNNAPAFENISITPEISEGANVIVTGHITEIVSGQPNEPKSRGHAWF